MSIHESQLAGLRAFGYTEAEARFLYLVAAHSGYFTVRQFLDFAHARSGKRNARFVEKLFVWVMPRPEDTPGEASSITCVPGSFMR